MVSVKPCLDELAIWVEEVHHGVCVGLVACRENDNLKMLVRSLERLDGKGPNVESRINDFTIWKMNCNHMVNIQTLVVFNTMHEGLVEVKNDHLFLTGVVWRGKLHGAILNIGHGN
jgi:hypothetical protein